MMTLKLNNGMLIPQMGAGTWTLHGETATNNVCKALQAGFRHIDTAQMYANELEVGKAIVLSGVERDKIFLTTKVSPPAMREGREAVRKSIDESLSNLNTYIDLLLIHWPVKDAVEFTWKIMESYVKEGKIRAVGISNFNPHHIEELLSYAEIRPVVNQIEVHPYMSQVDVIEFNHKHGIQVEAWGPFGQGDIDIVGNPVLQSLAKKHDKTISQIVLRWIVQRGLVTIPRCRPRHFAENLEVMHFTLPDDDMQAINGLNINHRSDPRNNPENFPW